MRLCGRWYPTPSRPPCPTCLPPPATRTTTNFYRGKLEYLYVPLLIISLLHGRKGKKQPHMLVIALNKVQLCKFVYGQSHTWLWEGKYTWTMFWGGAAVCCWSFRANTTYTVFFFCFSLINKTSKKTNKNIFSLFRAITFHFMRVNSLPPITQIMAADGRVSARVTEIVNRPILVTWIFSRM